MAVKIAIAALIAILTLFAALTVHAAESGLPEPVKTLTPAELNGPSGDDDPMFQREYGDALLLYQSGHKEAGMYKLQLLLVKFPNNVRLLRKLAEMAIEQDNRAYAIQMLQRAMSISPGDLEGRLSLVKIYRAYNMPVLAMMALREALQKDPDCREALQELSGYYQENGFYAEEELLLRRLCSISADFNNFSRLATVIGNEGDNWEEILVYRDMAERFPEHRETLNQLARLYGNDMDYYRQLQSYRKILAADPSQGLVKNDFRRLYKAYSVDQGIKDYAYVGSLFEGSRMQAWSYKDELSTLYRWNLLFSAYPVIPTGFTFENDTASTQKDNGINLGYEHVFLFGRGHVGIDMMYRNTRFAPKPGQNMTGETDADSTYFGLNWECRNRAESNIAYLQGGVLSLGVKGNLMPAPGSGITAATEPWLNQNNLGGSLFVGRADYSIRLGKRFWSDFYVARDVVPDIQALSRLITHADYGFGLASQWRDGTAFTCKAEYSTISDGNWRQQYSVVLEYPLLLTGTVRDMKGFRKGYLRSIPDAGLYLSYEGTYLNYGALSPYYGCYQNEWQNRARLHGDLRIGQNVYLKAEGGVESGRVLVNGMSYRAGIMYEDPKSQNTLELNFMHLYEKIKEGSEATQYFEGDSIIDGVELRAGYHF
jgi:tetratricopeptide (TPR) repeat protein